MPRGSKLGPVLVGGLALAVLLLLADETPELQPDKRKPAPPPKPPPPAPEPPRREPEPAGDDARDDETALARMLASEDRRRGVRIVIGWITVQRARRGKMSIYSLITSNKGYGRLEGRQAATHERPTKETRELARGILSGKYYPSAQIRAHRPGAWAERKVKQSVSDRFLFDLQYKWNEGIYASIENTNWLLYSTDSPIITAGPPYRDISARLDALPKVPALDPLVS